MSESLKAFTSYQKFVVAMLAFLQFTIVLDFVILSPLGALLMPALQITPAQFGVVISSYAFCAGASGFLTAGFADRFDRKRLLLFFYSGFVIGTLLCGLANTYELLLIARMVTGVFAGVIGSIIFAIVADLFPFEARGRVMGVVQTAFSASQVLGVPAGLFIANYLGWNATFHMIVLVSVFVGVVLMTRLRPIDGHLSLRNPDRNAFRHLLQTVTTGRYVQGFTATAFLSIGGFILLPFMSAFFVNNLGVPIDILPVVYMIAGLCTLIAGPILGRLSDRYGKYAIFLFGAVLSIVMVAIYTNMSLSPLWLVIVVNILLFVAVTARMISASALVSAVPKPADRGAYMSVSSSLQQVSGGFAAALGGAIIKQNPSGTLVHFNVAGYLVILATTVTIVLMHLINRRIISES